MPLSGLPSGTAGIDSSPVVGVALRPYAMPSHSHVLLPWLDACPAVGESVHVLVGESLVRLAWVYSMLYSALILLTYSASVVIVGSRCDFGSLMSHVSGLSRRVLSHRITSGFDCESIFASLRQRLANERQRISDHLSRSRRASRFQHIGSIRLVARQRHKERCRFTG